MPISSWSTTASTNATADAASGVNFAEGQSPGSLNDSMRALMAVVKGDWDAAKGDWDAANLSDVPTAWTSAATGASAGSGALGSATGTIRTKKIGRLVFVQVDLTVSSIGTGAASILVSLPYTAAATAILAGRDDGVSGRLLQGRIYAAGSQLAILNYDGTFPAANGSRLILSGVYEATS